MSAPARQPIPLRFWTAAQCAELAAVVEGAFRTWAPDWFAPADTPTCACQEADGDTLVADSFSPIGGAGQARAWLTTDGHRHGRDALMAALFEVDGRQMTQSTLAAEVASQAWEALLEGLRRALRLEAGVNLSAPAKTDLRIWSGSLSVQLRAGSLQLDLLLNGDCVQPLVTALARGNRPPRSMELSPVLHAISRRPVRVKVELSPFELDLGTVQDLAVGDVVPLGHSLATPVFVSAAGTPFCTGFLGRQSGSKAVELARDAARPGEPLSLTISEGSSR